MPAPTHFLCIPLVTSASRPQLARSLAGFAADVTSAGSFRVPAGAIRPVGTLHLTLAIMSFPRDEGLARAVDVLRSLRPREILAAAGSSAGLGAVSGREAGGRAGAEEEKEKAKRGESEQKEAADRSKDTASAVATEPTTGAGASSGTGTTTTSGRAEAEPAEKDEDRRPSISITLRGLRSMQPNTAKASVLYAPPSDPIGLLQRFCEAVRQVFSDAGLLVEDQRPLLLHATIINTIYVKSPKSGGSRGRGRGGDRVSIDGRGILDRYEDELWMEDVRAEKLAICKMGAEKVLVDGVEDEAYEVVAEIDL